MKSEINVLVHPFTYYQKFNEDLIKKFDNYINSRDTIIFYSKLKDLNEPFLKLISYSREELFEKEAEQKNVYMIPTYPHKGHPTLVGGIKLEKLLKNFKPKIINFAGQTINYSKIGQCVEGIIYSINKIIPKKIEFVLHNELLSTMEGFGNYIDNSMDISSIYNINKKIILK
ncbi:MAG: hypothetical protein PHN56_02015 [Candidatus Nanoarchaeia archaeon]|nr:hypothetical protein [Candidatus Nanoarchaeia archaeon]